MASDRIQRRVERLLNQIEQEADQRNWQLVLDLAREVLGFAPDNSDAKAFLGVAEERLSYTAGQEGPETASSRPAPSTSAPAREPDQPTSFANGRYEVKRFLGEGGKKRVYLAQDTTLDREVAFALLKTEGLAQRREPGHIFISHVEDQESHLRRPHVQGIQFYFVPGLIVRVIPIQSNPRLLGVCNGI